MNPVIFSLGPLQMTWYGLLIVFGAVIAAYISIFEAKRRGEDPEHIWNMLAWILIFGIIGARLYHVFSNPVGGLGWSWYREHPIDIIAFWNGGFRGLGIFGAVLGGFLAIVLYIFFFNRRQAKRRAEAKALLLRYSTEVGPDLVQKILSADISTIPGLTAQRERVDLLRQRIETIEGWDAARLVELADVFAERSSGLFGILSGGRQKRVAEATELLKNNEGVVGKDLVQAVLAGDVSTRAGRAAQKERVAGLTSRLTQAKGYAAGKLATLAGVFAERKMIVSRWLDVVTPGILLAQAIGRMGNYINQELYGPPTTLPWGFKINPKFPFQPPTEMLGKTQDEVLNYIAATRFHPTFFYEALWNLVGFGLVMWLGRKWYHKLRDGDLILFYLIWYPLGRIIVEMFRPDAWVTGVPGLATAQLISLGLMGFAIVALILRHRNWKPDLAPVPQEETKEVSA